MCYTAHRSIGLVVPESRNVDVAAADLIERPVSFEFESFHVTNRSDSSRGIRTIRSPSETIEFDYRSRGCF